MYRDTEEAIDIVQQLNELIESEDREFQFKVETTGFETLVLFAGITLWCSEDDQSEDYEPLIDYLKRKVVEEHAKLAVILSKLS